MKRELYSESKVTAENVFCAIIITPTFSDFTTDVFNGNIMAISCIWRRVPCFR